MPIDIAQIRRIAQHQKLRQVDTVEFIHATGHVRITVRDDAQSDVVKQAPDITTPESPNTPATGPDNSVTVKSDKLGILRLVHPSLPTQTVREGGAIVAGQTIVYLEVDLSLLAVQSPRNGILQRLLVTDGQYVDYGMPLFDIAIAE